ncbi:MAG: TolC family protein, partial [Candidatus Omnitrophica bacterium]|nr:TolC family protein [Candidatus Omnitrophota bacterium]
RSKGYVPQRPTNYDVLLPAFEEDFERFQSEGRTFKILKQLEEKSSLAVDQNANELLPSIDLLFGYEVDGDDYAIRNEDQFLYAGVSLSWPVGDQVDRAELGVAQAELKKRKLTSLSTEFRLYTDIKNLTLQIDREKQLSEIAEEKIGIAQEILEDETENYSFGKVSINDYIDAVNVVDNNKFNHIRREVAYKKLLVEWLRITDQLVQKNTQELLRGAAKW